MTHFIGPRVSVLESTCTCTCAGCPSILRLQGGCRVVQVRGQSALSHALQFQYTHTHTHTHSCVNVYVCHVSILPVPLPPLTRSLILQPSSLGSSPWISSKCLVFMKLSGRRQSGSSDGSATSKGSTFTNIAMAGEQTIRLQTRRDVGTVEQGWEGSEDRR